MVYEPRPAETRLLAILGKGKFTTDAEIRDAYLATYEVRISANLLNHYIDCWEAEGEIEVDREGKDRKFKGREKGR